MALSFSSAVGNLYNRLGKAALLIKQMRSYQGSQETNLINTTNGLVAQLNAEPDIQALVGQSYIGQLDSAGQIGSLASSVAAQIVNRMVFRDNPQISQTLQSLNTLTSLQEVIRQMKLVNASVLAMTLTATPTSFTGTGNGAITASIRRPSDGLVLENSFAETLLVTCTSDSYSGSATAGNEGLSVKGTGQQNNVYAFNWPLGSDASTTVSAIDGNKDNTAGNILTNSGFEGVFTSDIPANWSLITGMGGTHFFDENSLIYDPAGGSALRIAGDGSNLSQIRQQFNNSAGTSGKLEAATQYSFNVFARRDGTAPAAGVLTVDLFDGNNVINDENATANSFTIDLTALTTNYLSRTGIFRTPKILPATAYLRLRLTTALTNGRSVYLDKASLGKMTQVYTSGPFVAVHAGSTAFLIGDYATVAVTNSRGAAGTLDTWQTAMARMFSEMISSELLLPSSASPTIADSLIS